MFIDGLEKAAKFFAKDAVRNSKAQICRDLDILGKAVQKEAESSIGTYQQAIGPYPAWAPLAQSTIERKIRKNYSRPAAPLFASGKFQKNIGYKVVSGRFSVKIGTNLPYIVYTELGTDRMPPRPVFGPAAMRVVPKYLSKIAEGQAAALAGKDAVAIISWPNRGIVGATMPL